MPDSIQANMRDWFGEAGQRWLEGLDAMTTRQMETWSLRPTGQPFDGGSHSYVLPVERADGTPAVLKLIPYGPESVGEPTGLRAYDGDGAIRLYEYDAETGAMLLERAEPGLPLLDHVFPGLNEKDAARRQYTIASELYRRLWRVPAPELTAGDFPPLPTAAAILADWEAQYSSPSGELVDMFGADRLKRAVELCGALADPPEVGIANHDTHLGNIVSAEREPWLLIDPKPFLAERAFDGGYFVFKQLFHGPLTGAEPVRIVADGLGADYERVRAWALLRAIEQAVDAGQGSYADDVMRVIETLERV